MIKSVGKQNPERKRVRFGKEFILEVVTPKGGSVVVVLATAEMNIKTEAAPSNSFLNLP